jgi:hypothetical protein
LAEARATQARKPAKRKKRGQRGKAQRGGSSEPIDVNQRMNELVASGHSVREAEKYMLGLDVDPSEVRACAKAYPTTVFNRKVKQGLFLLGVAFAMVILSRMFADVLGFTVGMYGLLTIGVIRLGQGIALLR